jgi:photosystem II stability/assembly factor-like uncharacterized protein
MKGGAHDLVGKVETLGPTAVSVTVWDTDHVALRGAAGYVALSDDGGGSWQELDPLPEPSFGTDANRLVGTSSKDLWTSTSDGKLWHRSEHSGGWKQVQAFAGTTSTVKLTGRGVLGVGQSGPEERAVFRITDDHTESVPLRLASGEDIHLVPDEVAVSRDARTLVVCGFISPAQPGCTWSTDGGVTFVAPVAADGHLAPRPHVDERHGSVLLLDSGVVRRVTGATATQGKRLLAESHQCQWAEGDGDLFVSCEAWVRGAPPINVFTSSDGGATWQPVPAMPAGSTNIASMTSGAPPETAWVSMKDGSLWRYVPGRSPAWTATLPAADSRRPFRALGQPGGRTLLLAGDFMSHSDPARIETIEASGVSRTCSVSPGSMNPGVPPIKSLAFDGARYVSLSRGGFLITLDAQCRADAASGSGDVSLGRSLLALWCSATSSRCFAIEAHARIYRSLDHGASWSRVYSDPSARGPLRTFAASTDEKSLFALGEAGAIRVSNDGGDRWADISMGDAELKAVVVTRDQHVLIGGDAGILFSYATPSGEDAAKTPFSYAHHAAFTSKTILTMAEAEDGSLLAVTSGRSIYRSLDGGQEWSEAFRSPRVEDIETASIASAPGGVTNIWLAGRSVPAERITLTLGQELSRATRLDLVTTRPGTFAFEVAVDAPHPDTVALDFSAAIAPNSTFNHIAGAAGEVPAKDGTNEVRFEIDSEKAGLRAGQTVTFEVELERLRSRQRFVTDPLTLDPYASLREHGTALVEIGVGLAFALTLLGIFLRSPLTLYRLYASWPRDWLKPFPDLVKVPFTVVGELTLLPLLARRLRVLDAWVREHARRFAPDETPRFVALPVLHDGREVRFDEPAKARFLFAEPAVGAKPGTVLVCGGGGVGKTTLLKRLLRWIHDGALGHPAVGLFVDSDKDAVLATDKTLDGIALRMASAADPERPIVPGFLRALLKTGRVVLAFDHVSELGETSHQRIRALRRTVTVKHVLLTSRTRVELDDSATLRLEPALLGAGDLGGFVGQLLPTAVLGDAARAADVTKRAAVFLGQELGDDARVPALVVWLFVQTLEKANFRDEAMPTSIAALYFEYVRYHVAKVVSGSDVAAGVGALRALARKSVKASGRIQGIDQTQATALFKPVAGEEAASVVQELVDGGLLSASHAGGVDYIRFALDPVAEYLAMEALALATRDLNGQAVEAWRKVVASLGDGSELQLTFRRVVSTFGSAHDFPDASAIFGPTAGA